MIIIKQRGESGQALVEFAFVILPLLAIVFGIIQWGIIFNGHITVTSAAREGARLAVVGADDTLVKDRVKDASVALLLNVPDSGIIINRAVDGDTGKLSVKVNGTVDIIVPLLDMFTGPTYAVSSESIMRVEVITP